MTQVRPVSGAPRKRYRFALRLTLAILRWTFITIGAMASAVFVFAQIYHANTAFYDPATYAIGVGGLFSIACGVMLMLLSRNSRLHAQLLHAKERCEELADHSWRLKDAEARATSLLETQGDVIVRRDCNGYITYANDAYCALAGESRETLLGTTAAMTVLTQGRTDALPDGTRMRDEQIATTGGARWVAWRDVVVWTEKDKCTDRKSTRLNSSHT